MGQIIVLPIRPEYVEKIFQGRKKYEYRKSLPNKEVDKILIYETSPTSKVVGEAIVDFVEGAPPDVLWNKTKHASGITHDFFDMYFRNCDTAYAYRLSQVKKYKKPIDVKKFGINGVPQSFCYVDENSYKKVVGR